MYGRRRKDVADAKSAESANIIWSQTSVNELLLLLLSLATHTTGELDSALGKGFWSERTFDGP